MSGERVLLCSGAGLAGLYALGAFAPASPDFDWTFGFEAYRGLPLPVLVVAIVALGALMLGKPAAGVLERAASSRLALPALLGAQAVLFLALTDTTLSGDGPGIAYAAINGTITPSNPLSSFLHVGLVALGMEAREALRLLSCAAGVGYSWLAVLVARECFDDAPNRVATAALLLTCGAAWLFFGSIELYAPVAAGLLAYLWLGLRWLAGKDRAPWAALALGVLVTLHGAALALGPTAIILLVRGPHRGLRTNVVWVAAFLAPVAAVAAAVFFGVWGGALPEADPDRYGNFLGSMGQTLLLPAALTPTNVTYRYALLDGEHWVGVANLVVLAAPVGLALALTGRVRDARTPFVATAFGLLVVLPALLNVSYAYRRDWDLFVWMGVPLSILGALRFLEGAGTWKRTVRVAALGLLAFVPVVFTHAGGQRQQRDYAHQLAFMYAGRGEEEAAARWRANAEAHDPNGVLPRIETVRRRWAAGDVLVARTGVAMLLRVEPKKAWAHVANAELMVLDGRHDEAKAELETALRLAPESLRMRARRLLGEYAHADGDPDLAIRHLERGLREEVVDPGEALRALRVLAAVRAARGDAAIAEALLRLAERRATTGSKAAD